MVENGFEAMGTVGQMVLDMETGESLETGGSSPEDMGGFGRPPSPPRSSRPGETRGAPRFTDRL
jgi:hypothetical protein